MSAMCRAALVLHHVAWYCQLNACRVQGGSASHAAVILCIMLALEGFSVAGADSNHLVSCCVCMCV